LKLYRHEALRGLFATAELLLELTVGMGQIFPSITSVRVIPNLYPTAELVSYS